MIHTNKKYLVTLNNKSQTVPLLASEGNFCHRFGCSFFPGWSSCSLSLQLQRHCLQATE